MTVFARVSQESVQKYHSVVSDILSFDARFNESFNVYDDAIKTLTEHYETLSETLSKLKAGNYITFKEDGGIILEKKGSEVA